MTIYGGEHLEWPNEFTDWLDEQKLVRYEAEVDKGVREMFDKEYEEYLWKKTMEDGPPQSDDLLWVKLQTMRLWLAEAANHYPDGILVESGNLAFVTDEATMYFETVWDAVEAKLEEI